MHEPPRIILLALLIALEQLKSPLTPEEKEALETTASQLYLDPDDWDFIKEGLIVTIEKNPDLYKNYQTTLVKLQAVKGNIPSELMPTKKELEAELVQGNKEPITFGHFEGEPDRESDEILNVTINVLRKEPEKTVKNLSFIERIKNWLSNQQNP
ncbi:hypothetical protein [Mastigocoleus testarum]|uniref:Uncharacterized protein n=1 Tax=Mastigocoleus testarum BC008 TaxID=371196 RepID=A0A0V7ZT30_9CYAN|nr:hypothetical protein [Mastigocoleus testarum]KST64484.1 hypothetical protein BC008_17805 [Mastigocoleus testarum BC008]KST67813.1 hypothetical protein BC008_44525 [Mastigocoleus testarum BC008]